MCHRAPTSEIIHLISKVYAAEIEAREFGHLHTVAALEHILEELLVLETGPTKKV